MKGLWRGWYLVALALAVGMPIARGQTLATTTVEDVMHRADGTAAGGTALISWGTFTTAAGTEVQAGSTTVTLGVGGALDVVLAPNAGATPMGSYYTVVFHLNDGTVSKEYWVVPPTVAGGGPVGLASVRNMVLPASVAMQVVSKQYVDTAIARAQLAPPAYAQGTSGSNLIPGSNSWTATPSSGFWSSSYNSVTASGTGATGYTIAASPALPVVPGQQYILSYTGSANVCGAITFGSDDQDGQFALASGSQTIQFVAESTGNLIFTACGYGSQSWTVSNIGIVPLTGGTFTADNAATIHGTLTLDNGSVASGYPTLKIGAQLCPGATSETSEVLICNPVFVTAGGNHDIAIRSQVRGDGSSGYGAVDIFPTLNGPFNHYNGFQFRPKYDLGTGNSIYLTEGLAVTPAWVSGTVQNYHGVDIEDLSGAAAGSQGDVVGLYIGPMTAGATNHGVEQIGPAPNTFGGQIAVTTSGSTGGQFLACATNNSQCWSMWAYAPATSSPKQFYITGPSGMALYFDSTDNTAHFAGSVAGTSLTTGQASATGTACTIGGYVTLTIDGISRKLAYCN